MAASRLLLGHSTSLQLFDLSLQLKEKASHPSLCCLQQRAAVQGAKAAARSWQVLDEC